MKPSTAVRPTTPSPSGSTSTDPLDANRLRHPHAADFDRGVEVVEMSDTMAGELLDLFEPAAQGQKRAA